MGSDTTVSAGKSRIDASHRGRLAEIRKHQQEAEKRNKKRSRMGSASALLVETTLFKTLPPQTTVT